jgi:hypothetical protein
MAESSRKDPAPNDDVPAIRAAFVVIVTVLIVFSLLAVGAWAMKAGKVDDSVRLPLLVIAGLVSLIALLAVMAIAFKTVHLANQTQALGLPDGTVRAVIALSLILIFAVVTVYLFSNLSDMSELAVAPTATVTTGTNAQTSTSLSPADARRQSKLASSQDFAKQLLIMLGTLITSITSFYFASSKTAEAPARPSPTTPSPSAPKLLYVEPPQVSREKLPAQEFTALGNGLLSVNAVTLRNKTVSVNVDSREVLSSETAVRFRVPFDIGEGVWDLVVKTREGLEATQSKAIEITS